MSNLARILSRASVTDHAEVRSGEALYAHPRASGFIALPTPSSQQAEALASQGWSPADLSTNADKVFFSQLESADTTFLIANSGGRTAHAITANGERGFSLLAFEHNSRVVRRRDALTVANLFRPNPEWSELEWDSFLDLLGAQISDEKAFWNSPAASVNAHLQTHLADTLTEGYWHTRIAQDGLSALVGDSVARLRNQFLDNPSTPWMADTARQLGISLDSKQSFDVLIDAWLVSRATDEQIKEAALPRIRALHPEAFQNWSDEKLLALWRSSFDPITRRASSLNRPIEIRQGSEQSAALTGEAMRQILSSHYGEKVIDALEKSGKLTLLDTGADLPIEVRAHPSHHLVAGVTIRNDHVYMVANRISAAEVPGLFLHEMGEHVGLAEMLGPDYGRMSAHFQKLLRDGDTYAMYAAMRVPKSTPPQHISSERLAYLMEQVANDQSARQGGDEGYALGQECLSNLRTWLFRTPLCSWLEEIEALDDFTLSPQDIAGLAREAVSRVVNSVDPTISVKGSEWSGRLNSEQLETLFAASPTERNAVLHGLPPKLMVGYMYALVTAKAPNILESIGRYSVTLNEMAAGLHGADITLIAGEVLSQGYALENHIRAAEQIDRAGRACWGESDAASGRAELKTLNPVDASKDEWELTHHRVGLGSYFTERFETLESALGLLAPTAALISDGLTTEQLAKLFSRPSDVISRTLSFEQWSEGTKAVDQTGAPRVMYHGTGADFSEFKGFTHWASATADLASEYAALPGRQGSAPLVMPLYVQARTPLDADALDKRSLTVASFFNEAFSQAIAAGREVDSEACKMMVSRIRASARREESGPYYNPHQFWNFPSMCFGADGAETIKQLLVMMGFDSIKFTEHDELTYGVFDSSQFKSAVGNIGLYDGSNPDIMFAFGGRSAANACSEKLIHARSMRDAGEDAEAIRQATGWFIGHDTMWRFEIDDSLATPRENWSLWRQDKVTNRTTLASLVDHPALFDAYPHLRHLPITIEPQRPHGSAAYNFQSHDVYVFSEPGEGMRFLSEQQLNAVLHEVQHVIQDFEGFSSGGSAADESLPSTRTLLQGVNAKYARMKQAAEHSPEYLAMYESLLAQVPAADRFREGRNGPYDYGQVLAREAAHTAFVSPIEAQRMADIDRLLSLLGPLESLDSRFLAYRLLAGEVEARNVQTRQNMSAAERYKSSPLATEDAPAQYIISWDGREHLVAATMWEERPAAANDDAEFQFSFAGMKASTANLDELAKAQDRVSRDADPEIVRQYTGWSQGHDGMWRFEIDDSQAKLINPPSTQSWDEFNTLRRDAYLTDIFGGKAYGVSQLSQKQFKDFIKFAGEIEREYNALNRRNRNLSDLLDHPQLFMAYPALRNVRVEIDQRMGTSAYFNSMTNTIGVGLFATPQALLKAVLHEAQHALQWIEDFSRGGSPQDFSDISLVEPKLKEVNRKLQSLMESNPSFAKLQRQINREMIRINDSYGVRTTDGVNLDWERVPEPVSGPYFSMLDQADLFPERTEYWNLEFEREQIIADDPVLSRFEQYRRLAGEVEARNVEARVGMNAEQRKNTSPLSTEDYPSDAVIVLNGRTLSMSTVEAKPHQTHTPAFRGWFDQSQIRNDDGTPQVVYHGTEHDFTSFGTEFIGSTSDAGRVSTGAFWFGAHPAVAEYFALFNEQIMPVYLKMNRPLVVDCKDWAKRFDTLDQAFRLEDGTVVYDILMFKHEAIAEAKRDGHDGVVFRGGYDGRPFKSDIFAAFEPTQIKSAIGNVGTFDVTNPDLRLSALLEGAASKLGTTHASVSESEMMSVLKNSGRLTASFYNDTELTPAALGVLARDLSLAEPVRSFLAENIDALRTGVDVLTVIAMHMKTLEARLDRAQGDLEASLSGEERPGSILDYDHQVRLLKADLGWFLVNRGDFRLTDGRAPSILHMDSTLTDQQPAVIAALSLLGFQGKSSVESVTTGRDLVRFLNDQCGSETNAAHILSAAGIDCLAEKSSLAHGGLENSAFVVVDRAPPKILSKTSVASEDFLTFEGLKGVHYPSAIDDVRLTTSQTIQLRKEKASATLQTLAKRQAWLLSFSVIDEKLVALNRSTIQQTLAIRTDLNRTSTPGQHNCLPWESKLNACLVKQMSPILPAIDFTAVNGSDIFKELVAKAGTPDEAIQILSEMGIVGAHSQGETVIWDKKCTGVFTEMAAVKNDLRFHLAFHGSPHTFDKFSVAHVGTGEGGQAFGHGLYFASLESVAMHYQMMHRNNGFWYENQRFVQIDDLVTQIVPGILAQHSDLYADGLHSDTLDGALRHALMLKAIAPHRLGAVLDQHPTEIRMVVEHVLNGVSAVGQVETNGFHILPADGARTLNKIAMHEDRDYSMGLHALSSGLGWKLNEDMNRVQMNAAFREHVRTTADELAAELDLAAINAQLVRSPEDEYWLSRRRDSEWNLHLARCAKKVEREFGPFAVQSPIGTGQLYKVDLRIADSEYLDFYEPYSSQSEHVRSALIELASNSKCDAEMATRLINSINDDETGSALYRSLVGVSSPSLLPTPTGTKKASELLLEFGIQGIKYKDKESRLGGGESYNYVVFDDQRVEILPHDDQEVDQDRSKRSCTTMSF